MELPSEVDHMAHRESVPRWWTCTENVRITDEFGWWALPAPSTSEHRLSSPTPIGPEHTSRATTRQWYSPSVRRPSGTTTWRSFVQSLDHTGLLKSVGL